MAASLRRDPRFEVEIVEGHYGEFAVVVDGEEIISGGPLGFVGMLPSVREVEELVKAKTARASPSGVSDALTSSRQRLTAKARSKPYRVLRYLIASSGLAYIFLLSFPQALFAFETSHNSFRVYSREPLDPNIHAVLDSVEAKLSASGIDDAGLEPRIFLCNSHGLYAFLSLYVGSTSFAKGYLALPGDNVFVNRSDAPHDLVFRAARLKDERSLSGVIAHEVTHLLVRKKLGYLKNLMLPAWKQEGYSEYVAGGTLLTAEDGVGRWKANPTDDSGYKYFKYYMLVKYLIDIKKLNVEEIFTRDFDVPSLEREVLRSLQ